MGRIRGCDGLPLQSALTSHSMPFARAPSRVSPAVSQLRAAQLLLLVADAMLIAVGLFCALLLIVRFIVFPQVESRRPEIVAALSARLGEPVEIDAIATGWDGWNPKLSIRGLRIREHAGTSDEPLLDLPRVDLIVAWTSLPLLEFRLSELVVD